MPLALKRAGGATSQGMRAASRSQERQEHGLSLGVSRMEDSPTDTLVFSPVRPILDAQNSKTMNVSCSKAIHFVVIPYSGYRDLGGIDRRVRELVLKEYYLQQDIASKEDLFFKFQNRKQ